MDGVSEEIWKNWEKGGKNEFTKVCVQLVKDDTRSPIFDKNGKLTQITAYINILIEKGLAGVIKKEAVVAVLQELVVLHNDIPSVILDVLNIADASSAQSDNSEESKERIIFCYIIKECEKFISDKLLKERLEIDTLQEVGVLKNRAFYSKFIKVKTKLYYKQKKFNLFREECEGFSKLITELNQEFGDKTHNDRILGIVQSLIGCFNLDPNRVLDIILESFENKPNDAHLFIPLIKSYMNDPKIISEVLGSKYSFLRSSENGVPKGLHMLTAQLLQNSIISLDDIYPWLTPDDKVMQKECEKNMKEAKEYFRKLQVISVNKTEKEESSEEPENPIEKYKSNQKLGLCEALLLIGDWDNAKILIEHLPEHYAVGFEPIALAMCNLLHYVIEPVYRDNFKLGPKFKGKPIPPHKNPKAPKAAKTFEDLRQNAFPMLLTLAPSLRYDTVLMCKVIRLAKLILSFLGIESAKSEVPEDKALYYDILTLLDITILPSLSYLDCNCCIAEEIWTLLKLYPYQIRYCLYNRWKNDTYIIYPELLRKRGDSEKQIKNIMKRVSKENVKPVGRSIGKLTHCSPGFLFDYVLLQIQVYNNLIHPVVDSLKYLTSLSYDVLGYCLIECLANADKKRVKHDSTSISTWLQSLSSFCGAIYKKYNIELSGLLQYVANQLKAQKSLDLLILKEVVQKMAGIESAEDLTIEQLSAMAGGELLRAEAGYFGQVRNTKKSSLRLKEAMADQNLAVSLCLLMAQQKYCVVYKETQQSHLKLVGKLSDQCQDTLVQFGNFLGSTMSVDEYVNKLPSIQSMLLNYHIPNEVAFFLARPMFNHEINIKYDQLRKADANYKKLPTSVKHQKYFEAVNEVMQPVHKSLIPLHPPKIWEDISTQFLATFWSLTMYDLCIPEDTYTEVINKLKQQSLSVLDSSSNKGKKEQERHATLIEKIQDEKKKQSEHVDKVMYRLKQEKDHWFVSKTAKTAKNETITRFLQLCLFPRCTFTAIDALYCAKFVHVIHMLKTPNFSTLLCYDRLFCDITYSVTSCTENEAMRYGRFLYAMLETVMRWHRSKEVFEKECANYPGFVTKFRVSNQHADNMDNVGYENYRHVCHKWHYKLAKAMVTCLESKDYIQIRNALIILIKIINYFPVLIKLSQFVEKRIEKVRDEEKNNRQDLFTLSSSYLALLKQRIASGNMVKEGDFHIIIEKVSKTQHDQKASNNSTKHNGDSKDDKEKNEKKSSKQVEEVKTVVKSQSPEQNGSKEKVDKVHKEETREKHRKEDKQRDDVEKEREREKRRERKEEKLLKQEDWQYREERERYQDVVPKDEARYSNERSVERYYDDRGNLHYYRDARDDREVAVGSNGSASLGRHSQDTDPDREAKRRKLDGSSKLQERQQIEVEAAAIFKPRPSASNEKLPIMCLQSSKHEERSKAQHQQFDYVGEKVEKKERTVKVKEKRDKLTDEERELRKERKLGRKRVSNQDRGDEPQQQTEIKRRRDEERAKILPHPNGELMEPSQHSREKHHRSTRELSPYSRERSHDRVEVRDKHRRSAENKRR